MFPFRYPVQGLAMYDTWIPTQNFGNRFFDYPGIETDTHAIGAHLGNEFQMSMKMLYLSNNTFVNVDSRVLNRENLRGFLGFCLI